jgi:hypothetical protein
MRTDLESRQSRKRMSQSTGQPPTSPISRHDSPGPKQYNVHKVFFDHTTNQLLPNTLNPPFVYDYDTEHNS